MRIVQIKSTATTGQSDPFEPRTNTVSLQVLAEAIGAVAATYQVKGRSMPNMPLENIGDPVALTGTNSASGSVRLSSLCAGQILADFSLVSCTSLSVVAVEANS